MKTLSAYWISRKYRSMQKARLFTTKNRRLRSRILGAERSAAMEYELEFVVGDEFDSERFDEVFRFRRGEEFEFLGA